MLHYNKRVAGLKSEPHREKHAAEVASVIVAVAMKTAADSLLSPEICRIELLAQWVASLRRPKRSHRKPPPCVGQIYFEFASRFDQPWQDACQYIYGDQDSVRNDSWHKIEAVL